MCEAKAFQPSPTLMTSTATSPLTSLLCVWRGGPELATWSKVERQDDGGNRELDDSSYSLRLLIIARQLFTMRS